MAIQRGRKPYGFRPETDQNSGWKRTLSFSAKSQTRITKTRVLKKRGVNLLRERVNTSNFEKNILFTLLYTNKPCRLKCQISKTFIFPTDTYRFGYTGLMPIVRSADTTK